LPLAPTSTTPSKAQTIGMPSCSALRRID
jgi:hypothetical protein